MSGPLARAVEQIHGRSLWQVFGIYLGVSWGTLQVVDPLVQGTAQQAIDEIFRIRG